ncbi:MAG: TVP38/TMEM64 family protein [Gemmatimonadota bacterium]
MAKRRHGDGIGAVDGGRDELRLRRRAALLRLGLLAALVGGAAAVAYGFDSRYLDPATLAALLAEVRDSPGSRLLFTLAFAAATAIGLPATALTLAGGAIFELGWGLALNWLGGMLGATTAYGLARRLGRDATRRLLGRRAARLDRLSAEHGFWAVLRLRLVPVIPFVALNLGSALAGVRARDYVFATALGLVPFIAVYTYFADALVAGAAGAREEAMWRLGLAAGLLLALSFAPRLLRRSRGQCAADGDREDAEACGDRGRDHGCGGDAGRGADDGDAAPADA